MINRKDKLAARIFNELGNMPTTDLVAWHNTYIEDQNLNSLLFIKMDDFDLIFTSSTTTEILDNISSGFDLSSKYFTLGADGLYHDTSIPEAYIDFTSLSIYLAEIILEMPIEVVLALNNWQLDTSSHIYCMSQLDDITKDLTPSEVIESISHKFDTNHDYFKIDDHGKYQSINDLYQYIDLDLFI